jgi:hypothetical protein
MRCDASRDAHAHGNEDEDEHVAQLLTSSAVQSLVRRRIARAQQKIGDDRAELFLEQQPARMNADSLHETSLCFSVELRFQRLCLTLAARSCKTS